MDAFSILNCLLTYIGVCITAAAITSFSKTPVRSTNYVPPFETRGSSCWLTSKILNISTVEQDTVHTECIHAYTKNLLKFTYYT